MKYVVLFLDLPFEPSYSADFACLLAPSILVAFLIPNSKSAAVASSDAVEQKEGLAKTLSMDNVKQFGAAGTISYVLVELIFWAIALPSALLWYRYAEGDWLDITDTADKVHAVWRRTLITRQCWHRYIWAPGAMP